MHKNEVNFDLHEETLHIYQLLLFYEEPCLMMVHKSDACKMKLPYYSVTGTGFFHTE